jgi:hypothetical protein
MRNITDHKLNGLNDALKVVALDGPGPGGANHLYQIFLDESLRKDPNDKTVHLTIGFQSGPILETGVNGISNEALLAIVIDRMRGFQYKRIMKVGDPNDIECGFDFGSRGQFACRENAEALTHLENALMWLQKRTRDRLARGVEGTSTV